MPRKLTDVWEPRDPEMWLSSYKAQYKQVKMVMMSPKTFLRKTKEYEHMEPVDPSKIKKLEGLLSQGSKIDPLYITYEKGLFGKDTKSGIWGVQGRHRAIVAKKAGISKIPVFLLESKY